MEKSLIDDIENKWKRWMLSPLFPEGFGGKVIYTLPYVVKLKHLLTEDECAYLVELSRDKYERSTMIIDGKITHNTRRTSQTAIITGNGCLDALEDDVLCNIIRRVCLLMDCVPQQIEGLMVVKYEEGEEFMDHWDYFEEGKDTIALEDGGQRIATFFVWLNDMEEEDGGATVFDEIGLKCIPEMGSALFWWNQYGDNVIPETRHSGSKVIKGTKYGLNVWIRYPGW